MKIVVISPIQHKYSNEIEIITKLFEKGLSTYHLRKPFFKFPAMTNFLKEIPEAYHNRLVLHSHHSLIRKFNLEGVHYTHVHLEPTFRNWWNNKRLASHISRKTQTSSCKKLAELNTLGDKHYSYVFLSPIFDSITGKFQSGYYEDSIKSTLRKTATRVVAMGGIDINRIEQIKDLGFYGMALNNCLWGKENPVEEYEKVIERCKELDILLT
jgi:thiamine-phosphate pyrophosphorylase